MLTSDLFDSQAAIHPAGAMSILIVIAAGVLLLWWKLHRIGLTPAQLRSRPESSKLTIEGLDIALWNAPMLKPDSYRDDTGKPEASCSR